MARNFQHRYTPMDFASSHTIMNNKYWILLAGISFLSPLSVSYLYSEKLIEESTDPVQSRIINKLLDAAYQDFINKDYESALINFQRVLQIDPKEKVALKGLKRAKKEIDKRLKELYKMEKKNFKEIRKLVKKQSWMNAINKLHGVMERVPNSPEASEIKADISDKLQEKMSEESHRAGSRLVYQGLLSFLDKNYGESVRAWKKALIVRPDDFILMADIKRAEELFRQSKQYETVVLGSVRARAAHNAGEYLKAIELWKRIIELDSNNLEAKEGISLAQDMMEKKVKEGKIGDFYDKGRELFKKGEYTASLQQWLGILEIDPGNIVAADYVQKIKDKGIKVDELAESLLKGDAVPVTKKEKERYEAGIKLYENMEYIQAVAFFEKVIDKNPGDKTAMEYLVKITRDQNKKAEDFFNKGLLFYSEGKTDDAITEWKKAITVMPNHAATLRVLDKVSKSKKEVQEPTNKSKTEN